MVGCNWSCRDGSSSNQKFQCRTRQVVGCNYNTQKLDGPETHMFQCRTRQVVGCNILIIDVGITQLWFQCRTRQVVGCNALKKDLHTLLVKVSMPHAASGRLQLWVSKFWSNWWWWFQCRTRQVVGCNSRTKYMSVNYLSEFQCRTRQVVGCNTISWKMVSL